MSDTKTRAEKKLSAAPKHVWRAMYEPARRNRKTPTNPKVTMLADGKCLGVFRYPTAEICEQKTLELNAKFLLCGWRFVGPHREPADP